MNKLLLILIPILLICFWIDLAVGSIAIPPLEVWNSLIGNDVSKASWESIIINYRLPRAVTAILAGIGLSLSGLFMQSFFRNPLAGPFVLGISSGASLGVAVLVLGGALFPFLLIGSWGVVFSSITGASLVFLVVLIFSKYVNNNTSLLIIGLMFSSATGAIVSVLQYFSAPENIQAYLIWTFGDLGGVTKAELWVMTPIMLGAILASVLLIKPLNILQLGEDYAKNAGLNIQKARYGIVFITAVLAGTITAFCGPIAFIGLAVPHITRMILDVSDHKKILPVTAILGAIVLLFCDVISRMPGFAQTLPLNAITSLFGGPLVIWLIIKRKNLHHSF